MNFIEEKRRGEGKGEGRRGGGGRGGEEGEGRGGGRGRGGEEGEGRRGEGRRGRGGGGRGGGGRGGEEGVKLTKTMQFYHLLIFIIHLFFIVI